MDDKLDVGNLIFINGSTADSDHILKLLSMIRIHRLIQNTCNLVAL